MTPRDRSKYGSPFSKLLDAPLWEPDFGLPSLPEMELRMPVPLPPMPSFRPIMLPDFSRPAECHHCGAPSPGKRCRYCGTGEAPAMPPDTCPSCRSHVETVTDMADFGEDTLVAQVCDCPTVTIYRVPTRGAARVVETKPNPRFYEPVVNADGKTIGYATR